MTPKGYTTITQIENYLLTVIALDFQDQVKDWIAIIEKWIENETGRVFIANSVASVRKFQTESFKETAIGSYRTTPNELFIDECVDIDELKIDGEVIDPNDYLFYPANNLPITRIKLTDDSGLVFTEGEQNIEVKAKWGYSVSCPNDISFATTVFVVGIINYSLSAEGEVKSETIGSYSVTFKEEKQWQDFDRAKEILKNYTKVVI